MSSNEISCNQVYNQKIHGAVNEKKKFDRNFLYVFSLLDLISLSILQKQIFVGALQNVF